MSPKCLILDYGMGNIKSIKAACEYSDIETIVSNKKKDINSSNALILPGVGSFKKAMENLTNLDLLEVIKDQALNNKPILGICLGMQLLFEESEEFGKTIGLGLVKGRVKKFDIKKINNNKIPHVGWSSIFKNKQKWEDTILAKIEENQKMYFVHSFYVEAQDESVISSKTNYGGFNFCSSVTKANLFATQFHPEKSGREGLKIFNEFSKVIKQN